MQSFIARYIFSSLLIAFLALSVPGQSLANTKEETYSISLVKTAETGKEIYEVDDKKVLAETHVVQKGDYIWKILRQRGLLKKRNLSQLLNTLKRLNKSLNNLDLIKPGEKIIIPLKIAPLAGETPSMESLSSPEDLKDLDLENYTVKPGDSLIRIIKSRYNISPDDLHNKYLEMVKRLNPSIKRLDVIHPRQVIRLPIYSPETIRRPIQKAAPQPEKALPEKKAEDQDSAKPPMAHHLGVIFTEMGEEWVRTGDHFIPLKSGGQMDLKAETFPIINLQSGLRVIVDLNNKLPVNMTRLIQASWESYRVVHLTGTEGLETALDKILDVCDYPGVLKKGQPLELGGDIPLSITADRIITLSRTRTGDRPGIAVINLNMGNKAGTPWVIKDYLGGLGIKVIDYPVPDRSTPNDMDMAKALEGRDPSSLITNLLSLAGKTFSTRVDIPVYQSRKADLKLKIKADFFFRNMDQDAIIDLTGLGPEVIDLLKEHRFQVLALAGVKDPRDLAGKVLEFLGIPFQKGPHSFTAGKVHDSGKITLKLPGVLFSNIKGQPVIATPMILPDEILAFLSQRGYKVLVLATSN